MGFFIPTVFMYSSFQKCIPIRVILLPMNIYYVAIVEKPLVKCSLFTLISFHCCTGFCYDCVVQAIFHFSISGLNNKQHEKTNTWISGHGTKAYIL